MADRKLLRAVVGRLPVRVQLWLAGQIAVRSWKAAAKEQRKAEEENRG